jgi:hypothetical protein
MRDIDDKIIYALNLSVPTESFKGQISGEEQCKHLYTDLKLGAGRRNAVIKECIIQTANNVKTLKQDREQDQSIDKAFKAEQRKVSLLFIRGSGSISVWLIQSTPCTGGGTCRMDIDAG